MATDHALIELERSFYDKENRRNERYREYARGEQPCTLTPEQEELLAGINGNDRADNVCHQIVAEAADRLELVGFEVPNAPVQAFLDELYIKNALADLQGEVHYDAARDGNVAVLVRFQPTGETAPYGRVVFDLEPWWDGIQGVFVAPAMEGKEAYAVKDRIVSGKGARESLPIQTDDKGQAKVPLISSLSEGLRVRRYVYYDDRIERYERPLNYTIVAGSEDLGWTPYEDPLDPPRTLYVGGGRHILGWVKADGSPLHIPLVHFANAGRMLGIQGMSELSGGVLNFQDEINETQADLTAATRLTAFQILWMKGYTATRDPKYPSEERYIPPVLKLQPGAFLHDTSESFEVGALPAGDITQILASYGCKLESVARSTRTPRHAITGGDWPSGEALERAERPSRAKAKRQAAKHGVSWATVMHRAVELANAFAKAGLDEGALIKPIWGPFGEAQATQTGAAGEAGTQSASQTGNKSLTDTTTNAGNQPA